MNYDRRATRAAVAELLAMFAPFADLPMVDEVLSFAPAGHGQRSNDRAPRAQEVSRAPLRPGPPADVPNAC